jgi:hypothetical protein
VHLICYAARFEFDRGLLVAVLGHQLLKHDAAKALRVGAETGWPPRSSQRKFKMFASWSACHKMRTEPLWIVEVIWALAMRRGSQCPQIR